MTQDERVQRLHAVLDSIIEGVDRLRTLAQERPEDLLLNNDDEELSDMDQTIWDMLDFWGGGK